MGSARVAKSLPLKVAAVCYRRRGNEVEFLLVSTNGGNKWTFPKGSTDPRLSHSQAAEREAAEEAGASARLKPAISISTSIPRAFSGSPEGCRNSWSRPS